MAAMSSALSASELRNCAASTVTSARLARGGYVTLNDP